MPRYTRRERQAMYLVRDVSRLKRFLIALGGLLLGLVVVYVFSVLFLSLGAAVGLK